MDRDGRVFMLLHAQEQARQVDILDSLPAHVALVDNAGRIVSVNRAWRDFADANGLAGTTQVMKASARPRKAQDAQDSREMWRNY